MADAHAQPHHDYHLVDPSPWPIVGAISTFILAVGAITWMKHLFTAAPYVFAIGAIGMAGESSSSRLAMNMPGCVYSCPLSCEK